MKTSATHLGTLLLLGMLFPVCWAQDKPKPEEKPKSDEKMPGMLHMAQTIPMKAMIVFTEYDGDKKIKSLPYTIYVNAPADDSRGSITKLRVGSRVPVYMGGNTANMTYVDVGTNIDARATHTAEGYFALALNLERSWVEGDVLVPVQKPPETTVPDPHAGSFRQPIIRNFRSELDLKLREGQTLESTMATDPISGKVLKVEVSLSIVK